MEKNGYSVKGVKSFMGMEGHGFNATLYKDGKRVAFIIDDANGGCYNYQWMDTDKPKVDIHSKDYKGNPHTYKGTPDEKALHDFVDTIGEVPIGSGVSGTIKVDEDIFISSLVEEFELQKQIKRWCRKETVFCLKGDDGGSYRTLKTPYCKKAKEQIVKKYGDKITEILNERFVVAIA